MRTGWLNSCHFLSVAIFFKCNFIDNIDDSVNVVVDSLSFCNISSILFDSCHLSAIKLCVDQNWAEKKHQHDYSIFLASLTTVFVLVDPIGLVVIGFTVIQ